MVEIFCVALIDSVLIIIEATLNSVIQQRQEKQFRPIIIQQKCSLSSPVSWVVSILLIIFSCPNDVDWVDGAFIVISSTHLTMLLPLLVASLAVFLSVLTSPTIASFAPSYTVVRDVTLSSSARAYAPKIAASKDQTNVVYFTDGVSQADSRIYVWNLTSNTALPSVNHQRDRAIWGWSNTPIVFQLESINSAVFGIPLLMVLDGANRGIILLNPTNSSWISAWRQPNNYPVYDCVVNSDSKQAAWSTYDGGSGSSRLLLQLISLTTGSILASAYWPVGASRINGLAYDSSSLSYYMSEATRDQIYQYSGSSLQLVRVIDVYDSRVGAHGFGTMIFDQFGTIVITSASVVCLYFRNDTFSCPSDLPLTLWSTGTVTMSLNGDLFMVEQNLNGAYLLILTPSPPSSSTGSSTGGDNDDGTSAAVASSSSSAWALVAAVAVIVANLVTIC